MGRMKVANKQLIEESLMSGCVLECDFNSKCYLCSSDHKRLYAVRFETYLKMVNGLEKYHVGTYNMTDSDYYKVATVKINADIEGMAQDRTAVFEVPKEKENELINEIENMESFSYVPLAGINGEERDVRIAEILGIKHIQTIWED